MMPMRWPLIVTAASVLAIAIGAAVAVMRAERRDQASGAATAPAVPAFTLSRCQGDGQPFTAADLRGAVHLVYFGFTTCPDVCPTELGWMVRVLRRLGPLASEVRPLLVTVDPERDSAARLAEYAALFDPRITALRGTAEQTRAAADAFGVIYRRQTPVSQQPGFYLIDHTLSTFVVDRDGRIVHRLDSRDTTPEQAAALIRPLLGGGP